MYAMADLQYELTYRGCMHYRHRVAEQGSDGWMMYCSNLVQEEQQQQHRALPHGFFCNLIFCKQEGQLLWLEDWAAGTVGPKTGDWVQASREQVRCLMGVSGDSCLELATPGRMVLGTVPNMWQPCLLP